MVPTKDLYILTLKSRNRKVGRIPVSTSNLNTCPPSCKLRKACYAYFGKMNIMWHKLGYGTLVNMTDWTPFCNKVRSLKPSVEIWRHNQAGDLPGRENRLHRGRCLQLARANAADGYNRGGYTYTHYPVLPIKGEVTGVVARHNAEVIQEMNALGFTVSLSANHLIEADEMMALGIAPVVTVLHSDTDHTVYTPAGHRVRVCPAILNHDVNCKDCKVCAKRDRDYIIGFPAHGVGKKRANKIVEEGLGECEVVKS